MNETDFTLTKGKRIMKIAIDAFGGDNAPDEVVKGAVEIGRAHV